MFRKPHILRTESALTFHHLFKRPSIKVITQKEMWELLKAPDPSQGQLLMEITWLDTMAKHTID